MAALHPAPQCEKAQGAGCLNKYGAIFRWPRFLEAHCPADDRGSDKKALSPLPNPLRIAMIGVVIFAIGLLAYDEIKTKMELGEWKNDRK